MSTMITLLILTNIILGITLLVVSLARLDQDYAAARREEEARKASRRRNTRR